MEIKCPLCKHMNLSGADRCKHCLHSLMQRDLPRPKKGDLLQQAIMTVPVSELLTGKDLLVASPDDDIKTAVKILQKEKKNCILVYQKKRIVGILSNRNLLHKVAGKYKDISKVKVKDVMTPDPEYVGADDTIAVVINKMAMGGFRQVPVLAANGTPLSIISIKDVILFITSRSRSRK